MAEISYREKVLLGYSPTTLSSNNIHTSRRNSDVDFSDVFGGPPRLSITHEYYSDGHFSDSFDPFNVEDEGQRYRGTWLDKPVFGDEVVGTRRRYQCDEDNFYGDIFMGGDQQPASCAQSPSRRDGFGSAPGSRVMSPLRPLSSVVEPFASPAKFSLPAPLANPDFMASPSVNQSTNSPSYSTSRPNHTFQNHGVSRPIARSSYRPSPLSHQNSLDGKELASTENIAGGLVEPGFNKDSKDAEMPNNDAQFHFSIYKWAGKGVPSVMPIRKKTSIKERAGFDGSLRTNEGVKGSSLNGHQEDMVADTNDLVTTKIEESQSFDDIYPALSNAVSYNSSRNFKDGASDDVISHGSFVPREFPTLSKRSSHIDKSNDSLKSHANATKSYMKSLKFFFQSEENGNEMEIPKMKGNESTVNKKGQPASDDDVPIRKMNKSRASQSFREGKVDHHRSEGTNKVKEFVKIFNQEPTSKPKKHVLGRENRSSRWDEKSVTQEVNEVKSKSAEKHTKMQASKAKESKTLPKASKVEDGSSSMFEKQQFDVKIVGSVPASAKENDAGRGAAPNINATTESGFMDAELPQEIDMNLEVEHKEETEDCESKILQWSKGKEGNIRALLSTLQYVLWPDSGWKSVPLVDIIEANAVKKAYQRALLRLHPDKLQQKGAAMHQKFIAEKVFDILQEAWDQFNSTGPI